MADKKTIIAIKVNFELNTKDGLRRVIFGLEKNKKDGVLTWKINFQLFEREKKTDAYTDPLVKLDVEVDQELHQDAADVAAANRLTTGQKTQALGPAAEALKAAKNGELAQEVADEAVKETLVA
jgi:hypothetical protein